MLTDKLKKKFGNPDNFQYNYIGDELISYGHNCCADINKDNFWETCHLRRVHGEQHVEGDDDRFSIYFFEGCPYFTVKHRNQNTSPRTILSERLLARMLENGIKRHLVIFYPYFSNLPVDVAQHRRGSLIKEFPNLDAFIQGTGDYKSYYMKSFAEQPFEYNNGEWENDIQVYQQSSRSAKRKNQKSTSNERENMEEHRPDIARRRSRSKQKHRSISKSRSKSRSRSRRLK